ncbi:MAG: enoyl-CoA hydratase [Myxococcales bacterium]|nr:enoyl-CoA hydratase [Myxococcales bacterium]|tara:strand:+ start:154 stop:1044 length:891 start_codon:yes stop_codon:yes gene_type:complete
MQTLERIPHDQWLELRLNRPEVRNAMSFEMVEELRQVFRELAQDKSVQAVVLRGAGGHFCAGGDVKDMRNILSQPTDSSASTEISAEPDGTEALANNPLAQANRQFGAMLQEIQHAPQVVIAVLEGTVMGGGFGLACVSDIALAHPEARFALPEVTLGLTPAQIAPFVVTRLGAARARHLALTGARFDGRTALRYGLVHDIFEDETSLQAQLTQTLTYLSKCAPEARAATKQLILSVGEAPLSQVLDQAALGFAHAAREGEGMAGMMAFVTKQPAPWRQAWGHIEYGEPSAEREPS